MKLFSLSMAGILAVSSCNVAGGVVFAEETEVLEENTKDEVVEAEDEKTVGTTPVSNDGENDNESDNENEADDEVDNEQADDESADEVDNENEADDESVDEVDKEEVADESVDEADKEEVADESGNVVVESDVVSEDVELTQCYGTELSFDNTSTWDDKGEINLGLSTEKPLASGATVSFDLYIPFFQK